MRRDCSRGACEDCDLGDACPDYCIEEVQELSPAYPCPRCNTPSWSQETIVRDGDSEVTHTLVRECPRCHLVWQP